MLYFSVLRPMKLISRSQKGVFTSQECLAYFDQKKDIFLQVDASMQGLGAALMQKDQQGRLKPDVYASRSLTDAEKRYSNIEYELLAVVFGYIRFHYYLYARNLNVTVTINL